MRRPGAFSLPAQVVLWAAGSSAAGAVVGLAVGLFLDKPLGPTLFLMSLLFGTVVGLTVFAFVQYYMIDVMVQIMALRETTFFVPVSMPMVKSMLETDPKS